MMNQMLLVGLGGGIGSIARWLCQRWVAYHWHHYFFWATFGVNVIGCFLIGIFWGLHFKSFSGNENWKLFLMTGLCGGFTTFSAFTLESIGLLKENRTGMFLLYLGGSVLTGILATWLGMKLAR